MLQFLHSQWIMHSCDVSPAPCCAVFSRSCPFVFQPFWLPRSLISAVLLIISVWMWPEWHSGCLWIRPERGGGLIFTTGLGNTGLQSLGEKMVLITDLFLLFLSVCPSLSAPLILFSFLPVFPSPSQKAEVLLSQLLCGLFWVETQNVIV